ncbi:gamma-glutamyltranspeptidase family protein [Aspergillus germanicus]
MATCSQPLAEIAGQRILAQGGNAADAAIAIAAALNVTEPGSTGIGGDMFVLFYDNKLRKVPGLNGSGRAPRGSIPLNSVLAVIIPGAAAGWVGTVQRFGSGKLSLREILDPAIRLAEGGFPVSEVSARLWQENEQSLREASPNYRKLLKLDPSGVGSVRAPVAGEVMANPGLAETFRTLAAEGKYGFYRGHIAEAIPVRVRFNGMVDVWEHPPNGQGLVALMALRLLEEIERWQRIPPFSSLKHNSAEYIHALIEVFRIAFSDGTWWIAVPSFSKTPNLLSQEYTASRARLFNPNRASNMIPHGSPAFNSCDTVYFAVVDKDGNAASVVNSNYHGFGSGIIPRGCEFTLQSRRANFSLTSGRPDALAPGKKPYHTIIPAIATNPVDGSLHTVFGIMGGFMQPQGHVQLVMNMLVFGMDTQRALDAPRVCIGAMGQMRGASLDERTVFLEVVHGWDREVFGRGQAIRTLNGEGGQTVLQGGSDCRADGMAIPV